MRKALPYLATTILLFSTFEITSKMLVNTVPPLQINFLRFLIGGLVLLPFAWRHLKAEALSLSGADWLSLFLLGLINIGVSMVLLQYSLIYTRAAVAAVIFSCNPLFVLLTAFIIREEEVTFRKLAGIFLGMSGVVVIFLPELRGAGASAFGVSLAVASAAAYGVYTVMGRRLTLRLGSPVTNSFSFIIGSLLTLPVMIRLGVPQFHLPLKALPAIAYLGIFVSGIAYLTFFIGLSRTEAGRGSMVFFVKPVLAGVLAAILLSEPLTLSLVTGTLLILGGLFVVNPASRQTQPVVSSESTNIR